jgi:hypothetical protein
MLERIDGIASYTSEDDRLQAAFRTLWLENPTNQTYGTQSRMGRSFLREWAHLFE